jgi:hypothetical protein
LAKQSLLRSAPLRIDGGPNVSVYACEGSTLTWCEYAEDPWDVNEFHTVNLDGKIHKIQIENAGLHPNAQPR